MRAVSFIFRFRYIQGVKGAIITKVAFGTSVNVRIMRPCDKYAGYGGGGRIKA